MILGQGLLDDIGQVDRLTGQQDQIEERSQFLGAGGHALLQRLDHLLDLGFGPLPLDDFLRQPSNGIAQRRCARYDHLLQPVVQRTEGRLGLPALQGACDHFRGSAQ